MSQNSSSDTIAQEPSSQRRRTASTLDRRIALILSGGNALGAYHAGAYQALHERGLEPDWVAGASVGAVNGAIICGNPREGRVEALEALWTPARSGEETASGEGSTLDEARRTGAAAWTMASGRPGVFMPRYLYGPWWNPFGNPEPSSLYDTTPLRGTIERLVDFNLLNRGAPRFSATAVDIETGDDVIFDTRRHRLEVDHIRASAGWRTARCCALRSTCCRLPGLARKRWARR
jgi:NTE family protein